jgi:hypothetical protein
MTKPPEIPKGTKVIERKRASGDTEYVVRGDPRYGKNDCWVATAYFGDTFHPDVAALRSARERFASRRLIGPLVRGGNRLYYAVGCTSFARWWSRGLMAEDESLRKSITRLLLTPLIVFARRVS